MTPNHDTAHEFILVMGLNVINAAFRNISAVECRNMIPLSAKGTLTVLFHLFHVFHDSYLLCSDSLSLS